MSPELITAIATLAGVALGIAGTLSAARIQVKGSHAQANATLRAAQTTATTQYAAALEQQNRAAQRTTYVGFLAVARDFVRRAEYTRTTEGERDRSAQDLSEPLHQVQTALAAVELDGPEAVLVRAREFERASSGFQAHLESGGTVYRAMNELWALHFDDSVREFPAIESLDRLRTITGELSRHDRVNLMVSSNILSTADTIAGIGAQWRTEFLRARSLLLPYVEEGVITEVEAEAIAQHAGTRECSVGDLLNSAQAGMDTALNSFILAARTHLNATAPETA
ncbi:hypothetical protein [Streptomyces sp. NPDC058612]|uniref:hypothetical protein n=1 Tax=Streptomyces sp. NPDC058612 TaxID=3346555 RepID=UPI0036668B9E